MLHLWRKFYWRVRLSLRMQATGAAFRDADKGVFAKPVNLKIRTVCNGLEGNWVLASPTCDKALNAYLP
jgi:hypothetical protein